jgi:hypothetical protein
MLVWASILAYLAVSLALYITRESDRGQYLRLGC